MSYTRLQRSEAAKRGRKNHRERYWITGAKKPIGTVPTGKVAVPINK